MDLICESRPSDSPFVERVWHNGSDQTGDFISIAAVPYNLVVTKQQGKCTLTVRGPEIRATPAYCPPDAEFLGIEFKPGVFISELPAGRLRDRCDVHLPGAGSRSFWLQGSAWEFPDYENADTFVEWLVREGVLVCDPLVSSVLRGQPQGWSLRTAQRRFVQATGLTCSAFHQIERARDAAMLLKQGVSILDTVALAGYADQPHLTRALKHYIGQTPAQLTRPNRTERLSFLFKTTP